MRIKTLVVLLVITQCFPSLLTSCNTCGSDTPDSFNIIGMNLAVVEGDRYSWGISFYSADVTNLENEETVAFDLLGLMIVCDQQMISMRNVGQLINQSIACSPAEPLAVQTVESLVITSDFEFVATNKTFPPDSDLTELFMESQNYETPLDGTVLKNLLITGRNVLTLKEAPPAKQKHRFHIHIVLDNGDEYEMESVEMFISPN